MATKLVIVAHGSTTECGDLTPVEMGRELSLMGLKNVGVIVLRACHTGREDYLDQLAADLAARRVDVGYLEAYKDSAATLSPFGRTHEGVGTLDQIARFLTLKLPDSVRVKVVRGQRPKGHVIPDRIQANLGPRYQNL